MADNKHSAADQFRRAPVGGWLVLLLIAAGALLLLLGRNALTGLEGDTAEACRRLSGSWDFLTSAGWHPDSCRTIAYSRLLEPFVISGCRSEFMLRLPSVIFAMALLTGTGLLTYELFGSARAALLSGWLLFGSYGFLFWGRCVHPAMLESCCILWGTVMLYRKREMVPFGRALLWFTLLLALWIFDGVIGMAMLVIITIPAAAREWRMRRFEGMPAVGALVIAIPLAIAATTFFFRGLRPWLGWESERQWLLRLTHILWQDAWQKVLNGHFADWWYSGAENLMRMILPWPLLFLIAVSALWQRRRKLPLKLKEVLISALLIFAVFGVFPARRWQIVLPLLPVLCAVIAGGMMWSGNDSENLSIAIGDGDDSGEPVRPDWISALKKMMYWLCAFLGCIAVVLPVTWPVWEPLFRIAPPPLMMALVPLLGLCALAALIFCDGRDSLAEELIGLPGRISGTVLASTMLSVSILAVALPALTEFRTERNFLLKVRSALHPYCKVIFVGSTPSSQALFYLAQPEEIAAARDGRELKTYLHGVSGFGLIGRNEERVRSIITASGAPVDLLKPLEKENTPIRLWRRNEPKGEFCLWRGSAGQSAKRPEQ